MAPTQETSEVHARLILEMLQRCSGIIQTRKSGSQTLSPGTLDRRLVAGQLQVV